MKIVLASRNAHKIKELYAFISPIDPSIEILSLDDIGFVGDIEEDGTTFEENALIKAKAVAAMGYIGGIPTITLLSSGATAPTVNPYCHPQTKPQIKTGMCIGEIIFPIWVLPKLIIGKTKHNARNIAEKAKFFTVFFKTILPSKKIKIRHQPSSESRCLQSKLC